MESTPSSNGTGDLIPADFRCQAKYASTIASCATDWEASNVLALIWHGIWFKGHLRLAVAEKTSLPSRDVVAEEGRRKSAVKTIRELAERGYIERNGPVVLIGECGTGRIPQVGDQKWDERSLVRIPNKAISACVRSAIRHDARFTYLFLSPIRVTFTHVIPYSSQVTGLQPSLDRSKGDHYEK